MSWISAWLHRPLTLVDSWFMWGVIGGVLMVVELAYHGVPGIAIYGWAIPLVFGLISGEDTWLVMTVLALLLSWSARDLVRLLSAL